MKQLIHGLPALHTGNSCIDQFCCMYSKSYPSAWLSSWTETPDGAPPKRSSRLELNLWVISFQAHGPLSGSWQFSRTSCSRSILYVCINRDSSLLISCKLICVSVSRSVTVSVLHYYYTQHRTCHNTTL